MNIKCHNDNIGGKVYGQFCQQLRQEQQQQTVKAPKKKISPKRGFSPGEKIIGLLFGAIVCFGSIHIISNQSVIYEVNKEIQDCEEEIQTQQKLNSDLPFRSVN